MSQKGYYRDKLKEILKGYDADGEIANICEEIIDDVEDEIIEILRSINSYDLQCAKSDLENLAEKLY